MRRSARRTRAAAACSLTSALLLALTSAVSAGAAPRPAGASVASGPAAATAPAPTSTTAPGSGGGVRVLPEADRTLQGSRRTVTAPQGLGASRPGGPSGADTPQTARGLPAVDFPNVPAGSDCPPGTSRLSTQLTESFEKGTLPEPSNTTGWSIVSGQAKTGTFSARSVISAADKRTHPSGALPYWSMAIPMVQVPAGRTILRFAIKGTYKDRTSYVGINREDGWIEPSPAWGTVTMDVTAALQASDDGWLDVRFANYPDPGQPMPDSTIGIDDVEIYTCTPRSNVRGDFDGDGIADVLTIDNDGSLRLWPGTGDLHVRTSPLSAGHGWSSMTWLGSPGDLNGDGRADLMARAANGTLYAYWGDGAGGFTSGSMVVGTGWQSMTSIVPMGDISGDGLIDVLACDTKGDLRRYWFSGPGKGLTGGVIVGTSFDAFKQLLSIGDLNGDNRWDVVGILSNGDMNAYNTLADGRLYGRGYRIGNGWFFDSVTAPGSFNRDTYPDVVARDSSGRLWTYPVLGGARWGSRVLTGTQFDGFRWIL
ncbi:MAG: VCBS repeat-containing protein [Dermatophilaceae bacterium]